MSSLDLLLKQIADPSELSWRDETYDLALARDLVGEERQAFIGRLIDAARADDKRAVLTLGYIGAIETLPALLALAKASDPMASTARRAVVLLGHGNEVIDLIAHDALNSPATMERVAAVLDLAKIGGPKAIATLEAALDDSDYKIRELAWEGLVTVLDLDRHIRSPEGKRELFTNVELVSVWLGSGIPAFVRMGQVEMHDLITKLGAGETPESLGVAWAPNPAPEVLQKTRLALFDPDAAFPVEEIDKLDGIPRRLAETIIALRLEHGDLRVPDALAKLDALWTLPILDEVAASESTEPDLRDRLLEAAATLRAS